MKNLRLDKRGFFTTIFAIVVILFITDITYITIALAGARFFDSFSSFIDPTNIDITGMETSLRLAGPISIVIINIGLLVLLIVSAWKRQTVETEDLLL